MNVSLSFHVIIISCRFIIYNHQVDSDRLGIKAKPSLSRPNSAKILAQSPGVTGDSNTAQMRTPQAQVTLT